MNKNEVNILWTNDNVDTSEHMVLMYATAAMNYEFWEKVKVIIWGASSKLVAENADIQKAVLAAQEAGVEFVGCISCAEKLGTVDALTALGVELLKMGGPLTEIIKNGEHLITV